MSKQTEAMKQALDALEYTTNLSRFLLNNEANIGPMLKADDAITALREALAEQPVATLYGSLPVYDKPAQQDLPDLIAGALGVSRGTAYDMMREALAEQQEPVAWVCEGSSSDEKHAIDYWPGDVDDIPIGTKLYTGPQAQPRGEATLAREPLTDERILSCPYDNSDMRSAFSEGWLKAEAAHGITKGNT